MPNDERLNALWRKKQAAYHKKQSLYGQWRKSVDLTQAAHSAMLSARETLDSARADLNHEYEKTQQNRQRYRDGWAKYNSILDHNNTRITQLIREPNHDPKHHRKTSTKITKMARTAKNAKHTAQSHKAKTKLDDFRQAQEFFEYTRISYETARAEFECKRIARNELEFEFKDAHAEHLLLEEKFKQKREQILDQAGLTPAQRKSATIIEKPTGEINIYHSWADSRHGHIVLDAAGRKVYDRDVFDEYGPQNFINYPDDPTQPISI